MRFPVVINSNLGPISHRLTTITRTDLYGHRSALRVYYPKFRIFHTKKIKCKF